MERQIDMNEVSDGKLYGLNDMVKAGCHDCVGCSACCRGMGKSIVLDPLDVYRLTTGLETTFEELLRGYLELNVVDGIILPNLAMTGSEEKCAFLNSEGRCSIHSIRPGICRLFPLGRIYENHSFQYFLQVHECPKENKSKVKVRRWIDTPDIRRYEPFINTWHYFLKDLQARCREKADNEYNKQVNMTVIEAFYMTPYDEYRDFYDLFEERYLRVKSVLFS